MKVDDLLPAPAGNVQLEAALLGHEQRADEPAAKPDLAELAHNTLSSFPEVLLSERDADRPLGKRWAGHPGGASELKHDTFAHRVTIVNGPGRSRTQ
eukprot:2017434-Prymnesium_polylepis.1